MQEKSARSLEVLVRHGGRGRTAASVSSRGLEGEGTREGERRADTRSWCVLHQSPKAGSSHRVSLATTCLQRVSYTIYHNTFSNIGILANTYKNGFGSQYIYERGCRGSVHTSRSGE